jgi:hypothetical protein
LSERETIGIALHRDAPSKPRPGEPCNGCGVCCATKPCPVAIVFLHQRRGSCRALLWQAEDSRYVCGMLKEPHRYLRWLPIWLKKPAQLAFRRSIAAGIGCDSSIEVVE